MNSFQEFRVPFSDFDDNFFQIQDWKGRKEVQASFQKERTKSTVYSLAAIRQRGLPSPS
jgi:hypothetical protein